MTPTVKAKWTEALRNGRYKQTIGTLKDEVGYCCLGVLCNVALKGEWDADDNFQPEDAAFLENALNDSQLLELGLTSDQQTSLIALNDDDRDSFEAIAIWIDENL